MNRFFQLRSIVVTAFAAITTGFFASASLAQGEPDSTCDICYTIHTLPPDIPAEDAVWEVVYQSGIGSERVAIVVWEDIGIPDPQDRLYGQLQLTLERYADDVATAGFVAMVIKFYGMAEDPLDAEANDLRRRLRLLWKDQESLAGAVLDGNIQ